MNMNMQYSDCSTKNKSWEEIINFFFRCFYLYIMNSMVMILLY
jgi:hypothetical protein